MLEFLELLPNVLINKIGNVLAIIDLRDCIILPVFRDDIMFLKRDVENSSTSILFLHLSDIWALNFKWEIDCNSRSFHTVPFLGLGNIHAIQVLFLSSYFIFFRDCLLNVQNAFTSLLFCFFNSNFLECTHLHCGEIVLLNPSLDCCNFFLGEFFYSLKIHLVEDYKNWLIFEEWLDGVVKVNLLKNWVSALLWRINEVNDATL